MKALKSASLYLLLSISLTAFGQTEKSYSDRNYIEVVGTAEKRIVPDEIYISIIIREREEGKEKLSIEQQEIKLKEALSSIGVPLKNLSLADVDADYIRLKRTKKGLSVTNEYVLKISDVPTVSKVFEILDEMRIVEAGISRVNHSQLKEFKKELEIMAIKAAKEKASYLLNAIGENLGKPIYISEQLPSGTYSFRGGRASNEVVFVDGVKVRGEVDGAIEFQKIVLQVSMYVKYEIL